MKEQHPNHIRSIHEETIRQENNAQVMRTYNVFFARVLHLVAQTVSEMCQILKIEEAVVEMVWSVLKVLLG